MSNLRTKAKHSKSLKDCSIKDSFIATLDDTLQVSNYSTNYLVTVEKYFPC